MPNYIRWREDGASYFFTVVTAARRHILVTPLSRQILRESIHEIAAKLPFQMVASVLLPDHLHCIWTLPPGDDRFPPRWRQIKEHFTRRYLAAGGSEHAVTEQQKAEGRRGVWQPRYWEHRIHDEAEYVGYRDYIHLNPVKHGYVDHPSKWPWSSVHRHLRLG